MSNTEDLGKCIDAIKAIPGEDVNLRCQWKYLRRRLKICLFGLKMISRVSNLQG